MACKNEGQMLQIELYVADVEITAGALGHVFDMEIIESKPGWRHLRHLAGYDFMLFDPAANVDGEAHWPSVPLGDGGTGIEVVICTTSVERRRNHAVELGFDCSEFRYPKWGSKEFIFRLPEGYLIRVKEPPRLRESAAP